MRYVVDKREVAGFFAKLSATLAMFEISAWLTYYANQYEYVRYIQQFSYIISVVLAVITVISLKKLIPKAMRRLVFDKLLFLARKAASRLASISKKIFSVFGINFDRYKRGKDEKTFIFGEEDEEKRRKRHMIKSKSKWKDLTENAEKIRFLYLEYILKLVKKGYKYRAIYTPNEVRTDLKLEEEQQENEIFDLYYGARYSGGSVYITDEQVDNIREIVNAKKK